MYTKGAVKECKSFSQNPEEHRLFVMHHWRHKSKSRNADFIIIAAQRLQPSGPKGPPPLVADATTFPPLAGEVRRSRIGGGRVAANSAECSA